MNKTDAKATSYPSEIVDKSHIFYRKNILDFIEEDSITDQEEVNK